MKKILIFFMIVFTFSLYIQYCNVNEVSAEATTQTAEACFGFDGVNEITDYYNNEGDSSGATACPKGVVIPSTIDGKEVISIGYGALSKKNLTSVTIPNSVTSIGGTAFFGNELATVTIPNSTTSIGELAFSGNNLTSVTIPNSVTSIGNSAFSSNNLTSITIPNTVTSIGDYVFCSNNLTSVTIPNTVTSIGAFAFSANNLTSVVIPANVVSLGQNVFLNNGQNRDSDINVIFTDDTKSYGDFNKYATGWDYLGITDNENNDTGTTDGNSSVVIGVSLLFIFIVVGVYVANRKFNLLERFNQK